MWPLSPRILSVCFAAFAFAYILMFIYRKKKGGCTNGICINQGISHAEFVSKASKKVQIDPSSLSFKCTLKFDKSLLQPLDDDDDIYNMVLFNDGFSRVYVFEAHNGRVKQGVIDEQSTS